MDEIRRKKITEIIAICNEKIEDQRRREAGPGYVEDYGDGRIVGGAALARKILEILKDFPW